MSEPPKDTQSTLDRQFRQANTARTLTFGAIGTLVGLAIAGFGLFTAKGTSTIVVPADAIAVVNQVPLSRIDFLATLQTLYATNLAGATPEQRRRVLDDMIHEELMVQRGKELDVSSFAPDVRFAMVTAVEQQVAVAANTEQPSDAMLRTFYDAHRDLYSSEGRLTVRDLIFPQAVVLAAAAALKQGQAIDQVLTRFGGHDSGKVEGEEFYFAARIHLGDDLFNAARVLPDGAVSARISADSEHLLMMIKNLPPVPLGFSDARARVLGDYRRDTANRLQLADAEFLRKRANILIAEDLR